MTLSRMSNRIRKLEQPPGADQQGKKSACFLAENVVPPELAAALMRLAPANPFFTKSYADFMRAVGNQAWLLGSERRGELIAGCYGFISSGYLNRNLSIPSLPDVPCDDLFWDGLMRFCSLHRITYLQLDRSAPGARIPPLPGEVERRAVCEYVLYLGDPEWERRLTQHHRRKIKRALQTGLTLHRTAGVDACREHLRLMAASMDRRRKRGESIVGTVEGKLPEWILFIETGAGELFQAVAAGKVLSSVVVMRAAQGAFYESSGTSPEGTKCGASHFLLYSIARVLREESVRTFNLANAEAPNPGLRLFKLRFGAVPVSHEAATFYFGSDLRRRLTAAARSLRQIGSAFLRRIGPGRNA